MTVLGRFMVFVFYIIVILGLSFLINGTLIPESNIEGAWYYASIAYFLVSFLASPFFMKPTDTIASAVTAGALLLTIRIPSGIPAEFAFKTGKSICIVYCVLTILIALIAILLRPRDSLHQETFPSKIAFQLSDRLGRGEIVFSFIFLLSILISLTNRPNLLLLLLILWLFAILLKPHEILLKAISVWKAQSAEVNTQIIGTVRAFENPGIAVVLLSPGKYVEPGSTICILDSHSQLRIGRAVAEYELQDERWMRVLLSQKSIENRTTEGVKLIPKNQLTPNTVFTLDKVKIGSIQIDNDTRSLLTSDEKPLIGFVAEESMIDHIQIELLCQTSDVYEGRIVTTSIRGEQVFYQVIDAATKSEALEKKSSLGYFSVRARKIGRWDESQKRFKSVKWLPQIYAPVYLWRDEPVGFRLEAVGHLPGSSFSVLLNLNIAVTHNTAILGVLGCGKTYLALELIARLVNDRKKVICLDITKQYSSEMRQFYNPERDTQDDATIQASIEELADNVSRNIEEGGNWQRFRDLINENITQFMQDEERFVRIYNPEEYTVWKQKGGWFQGEAARATLTPVEITRIISEGVLQAVSNAFSNEARVCIVFEEAHSLIPEWNSISFEGDRQASMGTAKAILQGRKYGLGCIVVTQRTANVIKSVLNQCNTIFAMRTFDATGIEFLANYIGKDYTNVLSVLEERNAVAYGKAVSSDSPLIIMVNERPQFLDAYSQILEQAASDDEEDEIPF